jgi:hypothetical protein
VVERVEDVRIGTMRRRSPPLAVKADDDVGGGDDDDDGGGGGDWIGVLIKFATNAPPGSTKYN